MEEKQTRHVRTTLGVHKLNAFDIFNYILFTLLCFIMLYPFWNVLMISLVGPTEAMNRIIIWWPHDITLMSYQYIFTTDRFLRAIYVTTFITVAGTLYGLFLTTTCAYALAKKTVPGYKFFIALITATMFFGGGLIPYYMLIRAMGLMNTIWVLFLGSLGVFNFIIMRAFINQIPDGLEESATIDGANRLQKAWYITLPSIMFTISILFIMQCGSLLDAGFERVFLLYSPATYQNADIIDTFVFRASIQDFRYSFGAAVGLFKSVFSLILVIFANWGVKKLGQEGLW
jgi:putative aldouronate transport system permease protein